MDPLSGVLSLVSTVVSRIWPDKTEAEKKALELELARELNETQILSKYLDADIGQTAVNTEQAKSSNLFVSGARPYIMWGLGTILILYYFLLTGVNFAVALNFHVIPMPSLDPTMRDIILGLLGLGYLTRSYDKKQILKK